MTMTMTSEEIATCAMRGVAVLKALHLLDKTMPYGQFAEAIGLLPAGAVWREHFPTFPHRFDQVCNAIRLGTDGAELLDGRLVDKQTGKRGDYRRRKDQPDRDNQGGATPGASSVLEDEA